MGAKEARSARQHADLKIFGRQAVVRGIENQRTTGIATSSRRFPGASLIFVEVKIKRVRLFWIIKVKAIQNLRQIAESVSEEKLVPFVK